MPDVTDHGGADSAGHGPRPASDGALAPVWIVAGAPGAGKTTVAKLLAARLTPHPAVLDKDTVYGSFVAAVLEAGGREPAEREGAWYDEHVKVHEYRGLTATAREIRGHGCPVLLVAPFTGQIRDSAAWKRWMDELDGGEIALVWVACAPEVLRERLLARASGRDAAKLAAYAQFVERMRPDTPPPVPHHAVRNTAARGEGADPLAAQIDALVGGLVGGIADGHADGLTDGLT